MFWNIGTFSFWLLENQHKGILLNHSSIHDTAIQYRFKLFFNKKNNHQAIRLNCNRLNVKYWFVRVFFFHVTDKERWRTIGFFSSMLQIKKGGGLSFNSTLTLTKMNEKMVSLILHEYSILFILEFLFILEGFLQPSDFRFGISCWSFLKNSKFPTKEDPGSSLCLVNVVPTLIERSDVKMTSCDGWKADSWSSFKCEASKVAPRSYIHIIYITYFGVFSKTRGSGYNTINQFIIFIGCLNHNLCSLS